MVATNIRFRRRCAALEQPSSVHLHQLSRTDHRVRLARMELDLAVLRFVINLWVLV